MVKPKIGISNRNQSGSAYDAVDLLEDSTIQERFSRRRATDAVDTAQYTIDSDEESTEDDKSSRSEDDNAESSDEYESNDDGDDESSDEDYSDDDEIQNVNDTNSSAQTEKMGNVLKSPRLQHHITPDKVVSSASPRKKSIIPPASSFKNISRKFPRDMLKGDKRGGRDKRGKHQKLSTIDQDEEETYDEESNAKIEQYTDKKYGANQQDFSSYSYSTSYSTADPSSVEYDPRPLRRMPVDLNNGMEEKKRKIVFYGFLTAIFICFIIAIVSVIQHASKHHVLSPPVDLENICDISNISTKRGHQDCERACEEAKCCMAPGINSCFEGQEEVCRMYAPCATVYSTNNNDEMHVMVPPAPVNLPQLCSHDSVMYVSGYIECNAACQAGLCCTVSSIEDSSLASAGLMHLTETPKSCLKTHPDLCSGYSSCENLKDINDAHGTPTDLVNSKCTANKMKTESGIDDCENACQPRACCFASSKKKNCYDDNKIWCDKFQACKILIGEEIDIMDDENNDDDGLSVYEKCNQDSRHLSPEELSMCKMICDPVSCCFYEDVGCSRNIDCDFYGFCATLLKSEYPGGGQYNFGDLLNFGPEDENIDEILPPSGGQHTPGPSVEEVQKACAGSNSRSLESYHPMHEIKCSQLCSNYMCCFEEDYDPISCHEETTCQKYLACEAIADKDSNSIYYGVCSIDNLLKANGYAQCEESCGDHMCCFKVKNGCQDDPSHHCETHKQCRIFSNGILKEPDIHGRARFDYNIACSKENIYGDDPDKELCSQICEKQKCCSDDKVECPLGYDCSDYEACDILKETSDEYYYYYEYYDDDDSVGQLATIKSVCKKELVLTKDTYFEENCLDICDDAKCCYDGTCDQRTTYCDMRSACSVVSSPSVACNHELLQKGIGSASCKNACDIFKCCWEEHGCFSTHQSECLVAMKVCET